MIKMFLFHPMAMKLLHLILPNRKSVMRYLVFGIYYITHNTYNKVDRRLTAVSISEMYNTVLYNVNEIIFLEVI